MSKYTEDDIRAAFRRAYHCAGEGIMPSRVMDKLLAELKRPKHQFKEGWVLIHQRDEYGCITVQVNDAMKYLNYRPLTQTEAGPWGEAVGVAIEALTKIKSMIPVEDTHD